MSSSSPALNRVVWFDLPVRDLERSMRWYRAVLGCAVEKQEAGPVTFAVIDHGSGVGGCLVPTEDPIAERGAPLLYMNCEARLHEAERLAVEQGGEVIEPVHPIGPHGFRALVRDSEGNLVALHSQVDG